ncbi:class I adenylate-forming enzyme family protein [Rhodococcus sp. (in: high G+C Gram-positive bacteria)]|uniref:class I adenylate-forming enzyme family protein n=1 Tax=Rhodococcus sp. TaxID=1831 RepID=UPI00257D58DD|nr:class I adenylate-forming enzyme family protein [Rhodococcus sp. (in: high G+C Gram-positive bacteria)]MBQ9053029.1 acyl--CoA ligase [Rhodococcus sp. (in: high G+C Gram-positive bacteria)]
MPTISESRHAAASHRKLDAYTVGDLLRSAAAETPDWTGLVADFDGQERRLSFAELLAYSENIAQALLGLCEPGERLGLITANRGEAVAVQYGAALAGIVLVPMNPMLRQREIEHVVAQADLHTIITSSRNRDDSLADRVRAAAGETVTVIVFEQNWERLFAARDRSRELPTVDPDSVAQIQFTSGSTGTPKGVIITHYGMTVTAHGFVERLGLDRGGAWINPMPQFHTAGNVLGTIGSLWARAAQVVFPFTPNTTVQAIGNERAKFVAAAPTLLRQMLKCDAILSADLDSLEVVFTGGETMGQEFVQVVESTFGAPLSSVFGMTETCGAALQTSPSDSELDRAVTAGVPLPDTDVIVADETGQPVLHGVAGELWVRGRRISPGYHAMPGTTAAAFDADGWLHTGDLAVMDERGYVHIEGRLKDMIKTGGENVSPTEVEGVLARFPGIGEVAVVGIADDEWGEVVVAVMAGTTTVLEPSALVAHCQAELAPHKLPRRWAIVDQLPSTETGKMSRLILRQQIESGAVHVMPIAHFSGT